jgi:hypothetical protein
LLKLGIVILHFNRAETTISCLQAVMVSDYRNYEVVIVDNGSKNDSVDFIRSQYPDQVILETGENLGYAGGNNYGIRYFLEKDIDYVLILNDDAILAPDTLSLLSLAAEDHPRAGFLAPIVLMKEQPEVIFSVGMRFNEVFNPIHNGLGEVNQGQYSQILQMDALTGSALLVSRQVIEKIGMLDERFFLYFEEVDWCYRGKQAGFEIIAIPQAHVWHPDTRVRDENSILLSYYLTRNSLYFLKKHNLGTKIAVRRQLYFIRMILSWTLKPRWKGKKPQRDAVLNGLLDYHRNRMGKSTHFR